MDAGEVIKWIVIVVLSAAFYIFAAAATYELSRRSPDPQDKGFDITVGLIWPIAWFLLLVIKAAIGTKNLFLLVKNSGLGRGFLRPLTFLCNMGIKTGDFLAKKIDL